MLTKSLNFCLSRMEKQIKELNYNNYDEHLKSRVVLVDFWAEWCHPCKMQLKVVEELAWENDHLFSLARLNVDDNKVISAKLGVRNIPTLILYRDGVELRRIIGMQNKDNIIKQITNALTAKKTA